MEKHFEIRGVDFHYDVEGEGTPVIVMHGWGCNSSTVSSIASVALEKHKVYNVDFPGFGNSTEPHEEDAVWGVEEYTSIIEHLTKVEGIESPILIGHSFGGRVAILFASRNRVNKVVLVDAAGVKPRRGLKYKYKVASFKALKWIVKRLYPKQRAEEIIARQRNKRGSKDYSTSTPTMQKVLSKVVNEDLKMYMPKISAPTLLIWGENDTATPIGDARVMNALIPNSGLVTFVNAGHYSFLDEPARFAVVLRKFIN